MLESHNGGCSDEMRWMLVGVNEGDDARPVDIVTVTPPPPKQPQINTSCAAHQAQQVRGHVIQAQ